MQKREFPEYIGHNFNIRSSLFGNGEWFRLDWINAHEQEITDEIIVNIVNKENESSDDDDEASGDENRQTKIFHTDGLKAIESAIEYIEQAEEA